MDGRSASATLLVWFPKAPSLKLIVESGLSSNYELIDQSASNPITIKRLATEIIESHSNFHKSPWTNQKNSEESPQFFQYFRVRVMARFILASSVLHDKDVLGGRINQYVDVTEFTAHRLRLEYTHEQLMNTVSLNSDRNISNSMPELIHFKSPARLLTIGDVSSHRQLHQTSISMYGNKHLKPLRVWIIGQHAGSVKIHLAPIDRTLVNAFIPPGLAKQLKDPSSKISNLQLQQHNDNNQSEKFHYVATSNNDNLFKEPSITVRVTDKTSIWPVGISAHHSSGIDDARQILTSNLSSLQNSSINDNNNNNDENQFPPTPTERMPLLSGVYSLYVELKGKFNQPLKNMHRKMSILSNDDDYYVNETDRTSGGRMASSVGFLVIYEQLHGRDKIPLNLSIKNCRPDLFWIETSSSGLLESKLRSVRGTPSSSAFPTSESSHFTSRSSFFRQRTNRYSKLARRSIRMKPNLLRTGDHSVSMNQHVHKHLLANELGENITSVNLSNFWSGPMVWLLHPGIKYSGNHVILKILSVLPRPHENYNGDLLEVGLTTPSGNILVPHVRIRGEIMTPKDGIPVNEYLRSNNRYEFSAKGAQENRTSVDNTHDSMAFKDAPGFQMTHSTSSQAGTEIKSSKMPVKSNPRHLIYSSTSDGASSNTVPINSDDISVDDRSSILSDVGGGNNNQIENNESVKDRENKLSNPTAGSNRNGINGSKVRTSDSWTSTRPVLELSMYILLGLFAVVGLVFAVNCGVVIVRYRWEKMNMNQTSGNANTTYTGDSSTASGCEQAKNTKPVNYIVSTPLPYTDEISNNSKEVIGQNQIVSSISSSPKCKWIHRSKSDADNQEKLLGTNNIHDDNYNVNSNKKRKRTKRSATSVFTGRQKHKQQLNQLLPYDSELSNFTTTTLTATINNDSVTSNNINLPKTVSNLSRPNKCSLRYNEIKKNSTTAVLSVGEADMLLLQSPYRESVWQDTLRSDTNESDSRFVYLTSGNFAQQFGYTAAMQPNSFLFHQMSTPVNNTPKSECQTLGRQLKRHTTAYTQRNYQGQECSIRIISNPMSDGNKRQHCHPQHQQFTNPQLFLSDYSSETINPTHQTNNNALTKSVMVSDSWLDNSNPLMLTGSVSASLHRKQITPVYLHDECTRTLCSNSDLLNANGILSTTTSKSKIHFSGVANFPVMSPTTHRLQAPCSMPCALPVGLPNFYQEESSWISLSQHQHEINEDWTKADYPNQPFLITKDTHCNDSLEYKNQSTIDRPDRTTVDMLDVSSPVCPLNSPWQVRRPLEKSIKSSQFDCCSNNQPCELHSPLLDQVNFNDNHLHFNEVLELNETGSYSQNPPYPPIRTTSRGAIAYHTLGHVKRSNNNDTNNYQPRPLSLPQFVFIFNCHSFMLQKKCWHCMRLVYPLNRTDSSRECVKLLDENNYKEHKTKRGNYGNNSNASEMYQDCLFSSSYDILSKYVNKQQSPSEESLWWYHPVHQKRRRKRKHESKKNADDKSNHNQHHHHHHKLPISFQKQQHQQIDMYISSVSEQSSDLSIPMMNKIDSADVNVDDSMDFILNHNIKMNSKGNLCEHTAENDFNTNTEVNKSEVNIHDSEKLQTSPTTQSSQSHKHSATIHNTTDKRQYFNSQSDLSWDQELLCLSHDRLVAYFAEMKESNA
ncbi:transmembrane protein 132 [Schistosoma japonicum]|nr:transmembrane protein 132 [Schistosoma japonicum]KAH8876409.1 transmembrane protein 132 [Schistosoma japonicum]